MTMMTRRLRSAARLISLPVSENGRTLVILLGFFAILDIVTTSIGLAQGGTIYEKNGVGRTLWDAGGPAGLTAAKLASFTAIAVIWRIASTRFRVEHARRLTSLLLVFLILINALAAGANVLTLTQVALQG